MVAPCGGGPASIRPNVGVIVVVTAAAVEAALELAGLGVVGAILAPLIAGVTYDLTQICSTDPPPQPTLTQQDIVDALDVTNPVTSVPAIAKLRQWFLSWYWYQACQCDQVNTPAPPQLVAPTGVQPNGGLPSGGQSMCWTLQTNYSHINPSSGVYREDLGNLVLPKGNSSLSVQYQGIFSNFPIVAQRLQPNITSFNWTTQNVGAAEPSPASDIQAAIQFYSSSGAFIGGQQLLSGQGVQIGPGNPNFPIPANAAYIGSAIEMAFDTAVVGQLMNWSINIWGNCAGDGVSSPCCPPDPLVDIRLTQIIDLLKTIQPITPVNPPTSWKDGIRHNNLGDSGQIVLAPGAVGCRVEVNSIPSTSPPHPGDPVYYYNLGFITPMADAVPLRGQRLLFNPQSFTLPQFADSFAYTLLKGTNINLVELLPVQ